MLIFLVVIRESCLCQNVEDKIHKCDKNGRKAGEMHPNGKEEVLMKKWMSLMMTFVILIFSFQDFTVYAEEQSIPKGRQFLTEDNIANAIVMSEVTFDENNEILLGNEIDLENVAMPMAVVGETCQIIPYSQTLSYGNWSTCKFDVKTSTGTNRGYCAQPQTPTPSGYYTVSKIDGSTEVGKKLKIALMFGEDGPWYSESTALFGGCSWSSVYAYLHAMVSIVYSGQTNGLTSTQVQAITGAIDQQYKERGNLSILNNYTVYVAYNDKQDIVWIENVSDQLPFELNIVKKLKDSEMVIPGTIFRHTFPDGTTEEIVTDENGQVILEELKAGRHTIEEIYVPDGFTLNSGKIVFEISDTQKITVIENTSEEETGSMTLKEEKTGKAVLTVEDILAPYSLQIIKSNENDVKLQGAEFAVYEDSDCTQQKEYLITDENGECFFQNLEIGKTYYLKEVKAPAGYKQSNHVYEIKAESDPLENIFEYYINGEKSTEIEGTKAKRIIKLSVINFEGIELPETGTHTTILLFVLGMGCMLTTFLHFTNRKDKIDEKKY